MKKYVLICMVLLLLTGCATTYKIGRPFEVNAAKEIVIGKTTQQEVLTLLGQPLRRGLKDGLDVFVYSHEIYVFNSDDDIQPEGNTLVIDFDENKVVAHFYLNVPGKELVRFGLLLRREKQKDEEEEDSILSSNEILISVYGS